MVMKQISFKELKQVVLQDQIEFYKVYSSDRTSEIRSEFKSISNIEGLINWLGEQGFGLMESYDYLLNLIIKKPRKVIKHVSRSKNTKQRSKK
jgi:hypothetical protein